MKPRIYKQVWMQRIFGIERAWRVEFPPQMVPYCMNTHFLTFQEALMTVRMVYGCKNG